jgi:zeaxanthin glucosyltransferase
MLLTAISSGYIKFPNFDKVVLMANILFMVDGEEGHFLPLVGLAKGLQRRQHRVHCAGILDCVDFVRVQGFDVIPIMQDFVPAGVGGEIAGKRYQTNYFKELLDGTILDAVVELVKPDAIVINSFYAVEALALKYRYRLPVILFTTHFRPFSKKHMAEHMVLRLVGMITGAQEFIELLNRSGIKARSFNDLEELYLELPEVVFKPSAFHPDSEEPLVCLAGLGIDYGRTEDQFNIDFDERPLIFCSLGSQNHLKPESSLKIYHRLIETMSKCPDWRAIISLGKRISLSTFEDVPSNVILTNWAPQMQILRHCTVMVNHGGWGAVKECIAFGVPVLAVPLMRDHFDCAQFVSQIGIGLKVDIEKITSTQNDLRDSLTSLIHDTGIREKILMIQAEARREDSRDPGVHFIESFLGPKDTSPAI